MSLHSSISATTSLPHETSLYWMGQRGFFLKLRQLSTVSLQPKLRPAITLHSGPKMKESLRSGRRRSDCSLDNNHVCETPEFDPETNRCHAIAVYWRRCLVWAYSEMESCCEKQPKDCVASWVRHQASDSESYVFIECGTTRWGENKPLLQLLLAR